MPARTVGRIQTRAAFGQLQRSRCAGELRPRPGHLRARRPGRRRDISPGGIRNWEALRQRGRPQLAPPPHARVGPGRRPAPCPGGPISSGSSRRPPAAPPDAFVGRRATGTAAGRGVGAGTAVSSEDGVRTGPVRAAVRVMEAYQAAASGRISPCRFYPSCSNYAIEAFTEHGFWRGFALTAQAPGPLPPLRPARR